MGVKIPIDLLRLRSATTAYLAIVRDLHDVVVVYATEPTRLAGESWPERLLPDLAMALDETIEGSPASIAATIAELIGDESREDRHDRTQ